MVVSLYGVILSSATKFGLVFAASFCAFGSGDVSAASASPFTPIRLPSASRARRAEAAPPVLEDVLRRDFAARDVVADELTICRFA